MPLTTMMSTNAPGAKTHRAPPVIVAKMGHPLP
jgi:hypothetical protein